MAVLHYVGLDVHKESIVIAVAEDGRSEARELGRIPHDVGRLLKKLGELGGEAVVKCCYEAGPTGYGLQRALQGEGYDCDVIAPSLVPKTASRVKTDRRDAVKLAHFFRSGDLTAIHVPDQQTEAIRDLERARDDAKDDEKRARQRLGKFLLRHGLRWNGRTNWTKSHMEWIRKQSFDHEAQNQVLREYLTSLDQSIAAVKRFDDAIKEAISGWELEPLVRNLQSLRGVRLLTSTALAAEIGDLRRFDSAKRFMSFVGLTPSENSSGDSVKRGRVTKAGNKHIRRLLVEAAWAYRFRPRMSQAIRERNDGLPTEISDIAWRAQERLCRKYRMMNARGKKRHVVVTAVARELAGFIWAIGTQTEIAA